MNEIIVKIISRFGGYNRVRIISSDSERFLNTLSKNNIPVWSIVTDGVRIFFNIRLSDMDKLMAVAESYGINIVITEKFGAVKYLQKVRRYRFGIIFSCLMILIMMNISGRIWNVNIYGARLTDESSLKYFLYENGYRSSIDKDNIKKHDLELLIKNKFGTVSEVMTDIDGVNLNITLFEAESPIIAFDKSVPVDIIASRDCIIDEIDVYNGTKAVNAGDSVKKGDVLISGRVEYIFKGEEKYKNVHAIGKTLSYEKVFCDNIYVDMYMPSENAPYSLEWRIHLSDTDLTYKKGERQPDDISMEMKNLQISLGWLKIPILYDEIRWYNKTDCAVKSSDVLYEEIYEKVRQTLPDGYTIKKMSYITKELAGGKLKVSVEADCSVNVGIEREIS